MQINKSQSLFLWYGTIIIGVLILVLGIQSEQPLLLILSLLQFIFIIFIILGNDNGRIALKNWKHILFGIIMFFISLLFFMVILEDFGNRGHW